MRTAATPPEQRAALREDTRRPAEAPGSPESAPPDPGVEGNRRLTSVNGVLLLILLAVQGITVLRVQRLLSLHVFIGVLLVGPVLLKAASTTYRFVRYYRGDRAYRASGPPHPLLRLIGPVVIAATVALLASGIALILAGPAHRQPFLRLHQASFVIWFIVMTVHVLGHVRGALRHTADEARDSRHAPTGRLRLLRLAVIAAALVAGVGLAATLLPRAAQWKHDDGRLAGRVKLDQPAP